MKQLAEARRKSQEVSTTAAPKSLVPEFPPGWSVTPFGSWEPVVQECPHFTQWTWGPYGYHATFSSSEEAEKKEEVEKEEEKMDDQPVEQPEGDTPVAPTAAQE